MEGTFPLPEAQMDRFAYKLDVAYPSHEELLEIANRTTGDIEPQSTPVTGVETIVRMQRLARGVPMAQEILDYAARLLRATHPGHQTAPTPVREFVRYGASPRGLQAIVLGAKVHALLSGRHHTARSDVRAVAMPALRHRVILNFAAQAEDVAADEILGHVIREVAE
jgi:MoxR-like ATPase